MSYIKATGICLKHEIAAIKKKGDVALHPIFEDMANSFEAIRERFGCGGYANESVTLSLVLEKEPLALDPPIYKFKEFVLCDNLVGLTNAGFMRIETLRDTGKGNKNKGTGRVHFIHSFAETTVKSCYPDEISMALRFNRDVCNCWKVRGLTARGEQ